MSIINVAEKGYVRLVDSMGTDLTVANTARVSFDKESTELGDRDEKLIQFLVKNKHDSCLRHCVMTFEVYAPLMTARQWYKHSVSSTHWDDQNGWNETSRRYVTENEEFYIPQEFLTMPANKKQGAGAPMGEWENSEWQRKLKNYQLQGQKLYEDAMSAGMAPEQARLFLPAYGLYIRWRWTGSLNAILNFLSLRLDGHAQSEIRSYASAVEHMVHQIYPITYDAWMEYR